MHRTRLCTTAAVCIAAAPALAGCPTGADMVQGIVLAQNEPFFMRGDFQATADGFVELRVSDFGGRRQFRAATYRHGLVMTGEQSASGEVEITYLERDLPVDTLPATGKLTFSGLARGPGGDTGVELELVFEGHNSVALAECGFATWTVTSTLRGQDGAGTSYRLEYSPELDLVLAAGQIGTDGTVTPTYAWQWAGTAADVAR